MNYYYMIIQAEAIIIMIVMVTLILVLIIIIPILKVFLLKSLLPDVGEVDVVGPAGPRRGGEGSC